MRIRHAVKEDAEALRQFIAAIWSEGLPTLFEHPTVPTVEAEERFLASIVESSNSTLLLAEHDGVIVGALDFQGYARPQMRHGGMLAMSVARAHRGRGIGRALLDDVIRWARSHGVTRLELEVFSNNTDAIRLYARVGFRQEGCRRGAVIVKGRPVDMLLMAMDVAG